MSKKTSCPGFHLWCQVTPELCLGQVEICWHKDKQNSLSGTSRNLLTQGQAKFWHDLSEGMLIKFWFPSYQRSSGFPINWNWIENWIEIGLYPWMPVIKL